MKFGYYILNTDVPELDGSSSDVYSHWLEQFDAAESLGFHTLWVTEHHFRNFGGMMPSPSVILAAAAQRTKRMRLGAAVSIIPMHNPLRIAEEFATVDQLSSGAEFPRDAACTRRSTRSSVMTGAMHKSGYPRRSTSSRGRSAVASSSGRASTIAFPSFGFIRNRVRNDTRPTDVTANRDPESFQIIGKRGYHLITVLWVATKKE